MTDPFNLERFVRAQAPVFDTVLNELRAGRKQPHWMWFAFPQLRGLGRSSIAEYYGISSLAEAAGLCRSSIRSFRLASATRLNAQSSQEERWPSPAASRVKTASNFVNSSDSRSGSRPRSGSNFCSDNGRPQACDNFEAVRHMRMRRGSKKLYKRGQHAKGGARCPAALRFDPEPIAGSSPAGMTGAAADGRPTTSAKSCSTRNATPKQYAMTCASCARAMPSLSTSSRPMLGLELARAIPASFGRV